MISSTTRTAGPYAGTGSQTVFPFAFKVFQNSDVLVAQTDALGNVTTLALTSAYTVALNSNQDTTPGGSVTMLTAPATGYSITLSSQVQALQGANLTNAGNFYPGVINSALDYLTILIQQLYTSVSGALRFPIGDPASSGTLPSAAVRANNLLGFDPYGNPIAVAPASGSAAALQATLALSTGAGLIGGGTRVVATIAALRLLLKGGISQNTIVTGYYAAGDWNARTYWYNSADTSSSDNGGTIIVAADGGRWYMEVGGSVSVCDFGAIGNANYTNGTSWFSNVGLSIASTDDTTSVQNCVTWATANNKTITAPAGRPFLISSTITSTVPITLVGDMASPAEIFSQSPHNFGTVFVSTVSGGNYTFNLNTGAYARGMVLKNFRVFTVSTTAKGIQLNNTGWDGFYENVVTEGFVAGGWYLNYLQDSQFNNCSAINCGSVTQSSWKFANNCNQLMFNRCHTEITVNMLDLGSNSDQIYFKACHFEVGEYAQTPTVGNPYFYPLAPYAATLNRYYTTSPIQIYGSSQQIDFDACTFGPNSVQGNTVNVGGLVPVYPTTFNGTLEQNVPFMISVTAQNVNFRGCFFLTTSASYSAKYLNFAATSSNCVVDGCSFLGCWNNGYSNVISGVTFINNMLQYNDLNVNYVSPYNLKFYGLEAIGNYSIIENNSVICTNGGAPAKNEGYLWAHVYTSGLHSVLASNSTNGVSQYFNHHTAAFGTKGYAPANVINLSAVSGNLNLEKFDVNTLYIFTGNNPLSTITNPAQGQKVQIANQWAGGTVSVANTATVLLKGVAPAVLVASQGMLTLAETMNGNLTEEARNF